MTIREMQQQILPKLKALYDDREAATIFDWIMEHITGKKKTDRLIKQPSLNDEQVQQLNEIIQQLSTHKPIQYILHEAWFAGMNFFVNEHVLIPRPETEELVEWIVEKMQELKVKSQNLIDIGTGSGCIAVALKKKLPALSVTAVDISKDALGVAVKNAAAVCTEINFVELDFLEDAERDVLPVFDIIVSNPPYIAQSESADMAKRVTDFEPGLALFVPDEDPLLFYENIARFGKIHLAEHGNIFVEINEVLGAATVEMFMEEGYKVELRKDMQGKDRMVRAWVG